jgi:hypothetical protein
MRIVVDAGRVPFAPPAEPRHQQARSERERDQTGTQTKPRVHAFGSEHLGHGQHDEPERQHRGRMHHGHRPPDRDGVSGPAAGPHQVRGHQRLAVARAERLERAEPEREEQRYQHERPGPSDETREGATGDVGSRRGRFGAGRTSGHRSGGARVEGDGRPVDVQRTRQEVLWVRQECVRHAALGDRRVDDRRAVGTGRGHLAPADPVAEVGIGEHELTFRRERSGERRLQPEDVEPSLPGAHTQRRRDDVERHLRSVNRERQTPPRDRARCGRPTPCVRLR